MYIYCKIKGERYSEVNNNNPISALAAVSVILNW